MDHRIEPMPWQREATADWQERFEALARAKKVEDNVIDGTHPTSGMTVFLTMVGNESYSQIKALLAPNLPSTKRYQDIKEAMRKHFYQVKQNGSTVATFVVKLRKIEE